KNMERPSSNEAVGTAGFPSAGRLPLSGRDVRLRSPRGSGCTLFVMCRTRRSVPLFYEKSLAEGRLGREEVLNTLEATGLRAVSLCRSAPWPKPLAQSAEGAPGSHPRTPANASRPAFLRRADLARYREFTHQVRVRQVRDR